MKEIGRRDFLKFGAMGAVGYATRVPFPMLGIHLPLAGHNSEFFTIAVIADTQNYSDGTHPQPLNVDFFLDQTCYLAERRKELALRFVTHVGDVVQHGDGSPMDYPAKYGAAQDIEWRNAVKALDVLHEAEIPFGLTPGNHDYDNMSYHPVDNARPLVSTGACWRKHFGSNSKYFRGKHWYGGASDEVGYISTGAGGKGTGQFFPAGTRCNYGLSSFQLFSGGGRQFLHIALEMEAGDAAIAWAQKVINAHPDHATIVTTHSYLSPVEWENDKAPLDPSNPVPRNPAAYLVNSPNGCNGAQSLWDKLIAPNDQIFLVLCGHAFTHPRSVQAPTGEVAGVSRGENIRIDTNKAGHPVYQVLSDYQGNTTLGSGGGDGWYRFMQFDMEKKSIHFYTLNAHLSRKTGKKVLAGQSVVYADGTSDFGEPKGFSDFSLAMPVQVLTARKARSSEKVFA